MTHEPITLTPHAGDYMRDVYWGTRTKAQRFYKKHRQAILLWVFGLTASVSVGVTAAIKINGGF